MYQCATASHNRGEIEHPLKIGGSYRASICNEVAGLAVLEALDIVNFVTNDVTTTLEVVPKVATVVTVAAVETTMDDVGNEMVDVVSADVPVTVDHISVCVDDDVVVGTMVALTSETGVM